VDYDEGRISTPEKQELEEVRRVTCTSHLRTEMFSFQK